MVQRERPAITWRTTSGELAHHVLVEATFNNRCLVHKNPACMLYNAARQRAAVWHGARRYNCGLHFYFASVTNQKRTIVAGDKQTICADGPCFDHLIRGRKSTFMGRRLVAVVAAIHVCRCSNRPNSVVFYNKYTSYHGCFDKGINHSNRDVLWHYALV